MRWVLILFAVGKLAAQCADPPTPQYFDGTNGSSVVPAAGGTYTVFVDSPGNCPAWTVSTTASWITLSQSSGQGPSSFSFTVPANTTNVARQSVIKLSGNWNLPVAQAAAICTLALSPSSAAGAVSGGTSSFAVQTACDWNAYSYVSWITVPASTNGTGNGAVNYTLAGNPCTYTRSGSITIGAGSVYSSNSNNPVTGFTVSQNGSATNLTFSPQTASVSAAGGPGSVTINTGNGCTWSYYTDSSWIQIVNPGTGSGTGPIGYNIANNVGLPRSGHIYVSNQAFTISQAGISTPVPQLSAVVNSASYAIGAIAPGEVISLGGTAIGPSTGLSAQLTANGQSIVNNLGGVQVLFDNKYAAALTYVAAGQINAIVPYEVGGQTSTQITVSYQGTSSNAFTAQVQPAAPAIFTLDFTGAGQGAILNQDYSLNGKSYPAPRGSTVMIFCTGTGPTSPASTDGAITAATLPLPALLLQPISVTIGGISAQVTYSGPAPGAVAGLTQINAVVPSNAVTGSNVPVTIQIGNWQGQAGVTMVVQ